MLRRLTFALALLAPLAGAAGAFHHDGTIAPAYGAYAAGAVDLLRVALAAGDRVAIQLTWASPTTDLDVLLIAPGIACDPTFPDCLLGPEGPIVGATCPPETNSFGAAHNGLGPAEEAFRAEAPVTGAYDVWVFAALAVPGDTVPYALDITLGSGATPVVTGPEATGGFIGSPHCRFVRELPD